jgi:hypothetical protein
MKLLLVTFLLFVTSAFAQSSGSSVVNCDKYPEAIGCSNFGTAGDPQKLKDDTFDFSAVMKEKKAPFSGSAQCPTDFSIPLVLFGHSQTVSISFQPFCDFAVLVRPMILLIGAVSAGFIFMGAFRL